MNLVTSAFRSGAAVPTFRRLALTSFLAAMLGAAPALAEPIDELSIQGYLTDTDDLALDGDVELTGTLYGDAAGTDVVHTETVTVDVDSGFFTLRLSAVDLTAFADRAEL